MKRAPLTIALAVVAVLLLVTAFAVGGGSGSSEAEVSTGPGTSTTSTTEPGPTKAEVKAYVNAVNLNTWNQAVWVNKTNEKVWIDQTNAKLAAEEAAREKAAAEKAAKQKVVEQQTSQRSAPQAPAPSNGGSVDSHGGVCNGIDLPPCYVVQRESGFNPTAENPSSTASGLYQFLDSTWAGFGGYSHASHAPVSVQVAKARALWAGGAGCSHWNAC